MLHFPRFTVQRRESQLIMCIHSFRSLLALVIGLIGTALHAQETWQFRPADVANNLWSVVYAANQWVAVGEQSTILTSPEGLSWTRGSTETAIGAVPDANSVSPSFSPPIISLPQ